MARGRIAVHNSKGQLLFEVGPASYRVCLFNTGSSRQHRRQLNCGGARAGGVDLQGLNHVSSERFLETASSDHDKDGALAILLAKIEFTAMNSEKGSMKQEEEET